MYAGSIITLWHRFAPDTRTVRKDKEEPMLKIKEILMDYEKTQCGTDRMPQFGWVLESDRRNVCK